MFPRLRLNFRNVEFKSLANIFLEITHGPQIHLRARQKSRDAYVHLKASLDPRYDFTRDCVFSLTNFRYLVPDKDFVRLALRKVLPGPRIPPYLPERL